MWVSACARNRVRLLKGNKRMSSNRLLYREKIRKKRALRVRKRLKGTKKRPRVCVSKSLCNISAQVIDDDRGVTLAGFSTLSKGAVVRKRSKEGARFVGQKVTEFLKGSGVEEIVFDRGRFRYHGLIAELADVIRGNGIKF